MPAPIVTGWDTPAGPCVLLTDGRVLRHGAERVPNTELLDWAWREVAPPIPATKLPTETAR
jgi:hypothetical protein